MTASCSSAEGGSGTLSIGDSDSGSTEGEGNEDRAGVELLEGSPTAKDARSRSSSDNLLVRPGFETRWEAIDLRKLDSAESAKALGEDGLLSRELERELEDSSGFPSILLRSGDACRSIQVLGLRVHSPRDI